MTKTEWDKCFTWLMAVFPQWKVDPSISAVWYNEIGEIQSEDFFLAVRSIMKKSCSPFPPGVFEIKHEALPQEQTRPTSEIAWGIALKASNESDSVLWTDDIAQAMEACRYQLQAGDKIAARMAFKEKYEQLVSAAEKRGESVKWWVTFGFDKSRRTGVVEEGLRQGLISPQQAQAILPPEDFLRITSVETKLLEG